MQHRLGRIVLKDAGAPSDPPLIPGLDAGRYPRKSFPALSKKSLSTALSVCA